MNSSPFKTAFGFGVGVVCGLALLGIVVQGLSPDDDPEPPAKPMLTKEIEYRTKTVTKRVLPDACRQALELAGEAIQVSKSLTDFPVVQGDLISEARVAISLKDMDSLTRVTEQLNDMDTDTSEQASAIVDILERYARTQDACEQAVQ